MNLSSPTYMPTCVTPAPGRAENSRMSPGRSASTTGVSSAPAWAWSRLMRGSRMPCWAYAYWISPEQSNPLSSVPPHTYGVPRDSIAVWTTSPALPLKLVGGSGGGSSGGALYPPLPRPPSPLPNPMETPMAALTPRCASLLGRQNPRGPRPRSDAHRRSEEHTSELQSRLHLVCRLLLEKKKKTIYTRTHARTNDTARSPHTV